MTLEETTRFSYAIYLHRYKDYNAFLYNFNIPKHMNKSLQIYFNNNKFSLNTYTQFDKTQLQLRLIVNYFIKNNQHLDIMTNTDYELFTQSLLEYKNEIDIFLSNTKIQSVQDLYKEYTKKNIPFYIFYYVLKFVKFKESFLSYEIIKTKLEITCKLMQYFHHFDEQYIEEKLQEIQKRIILS